MEKLVGGEEKVECGRDWEEEEEEEGGDEGKRAD